MLAQGNDRRAAEAAAPMVAARFWARGLSTWRLRCTERRLGRRLDRLGPAEVQRWVAVREVLHERGVRLRAADRTGRSGWRGLP